MNEEDNLSKSDLAKFKKWLIWGSVVFALLLIFQPMRLNNTPNLEEEMKASWGQVENVYQRRSDLIPNLVAIVKGYATHEQDTLKGVIEARAKATQTNVNIPATGFDPQATQKYLANQDALSSALSKLMVVVEKYPELKANQNFLELQSQVEGAENRIAVERKKYVASVEAFNKEVRTWPGLLYAKLIWGKQPVEQFKSDEGAKKAPVVSFK